VAITAPPAARTVTPSIDGQELTVPEGTTIYDAAKGAGIEIPVLCHDERYDPVGVCRMCVVDVGARVYAAACVRPCEDGMEVKTATPRGLDEGAHDPVRADRVGRRPGGCHDRILELEKTMRLTSICGLGQVALGPAISVLGLKRGGTEARPQPRPPRSPDQTTPNSS
jgi:ferredoxin